MEAQLEASKPSDRTLPIPLKPEEKVPPPPLPAALTPEQKARLEDLLHQLDAQLKELRARAARAEKKNVERDW